MIKGKSPFPFETIALALAFTPDLPFLVSEMKRLCTVHESLAVFIHVGKKTSDKQRELALLLSVNGFHDGNSRIYWEQGDIVNTILRICKHEVADLLLAGASEKTNFEFPIGQVSTGLATKSKCSVLIYSGTTVNGFNKIVVNGLEHKKTELTISTALYIAEKGNISSIIITEDSGHYSNEEVSDQFNSLTLKEGSAIYHKTQNQNKIQTKFISLAHEGCKTITEYAFREGADLIITHSSDHHLLIFDRISNDEGIEALLKNLSCSLLIVHSRLPD